jgi:pyridoxal 5'-phosphate synthase pdxS subunit
VLTPADDANHIDKHLFKVPFVCGCTDLGEALRRIAEGAALIRTKGEPGTGNVVEAVRHMRTLKREIAMLKALHDAGMSEELASEAKRLRAPLEIVRLVAESGRLPVPNFSAGGIATPADAALMMQLGAETVFVGSGIFADATSQEAQKRAEAIVKATLHYKDAKYLLEASTGLPKSMTGVEMKQIPEESRLAQRGW